MLGTKEVGCLQEKGDTPVRTIFPNRCPGQIQIGSIWLSLNLDGSSRMASNTSLVIAYTFCVQPKSLELLLELGPIIFDVLEGLADP